MSRFWKYFNESLVIQGMLTLILALAIIAMLLMERPVPGELWGAFGLVMGYWFGTKKFAPNDSQ